MAPGRQDAEFAPADECRADMAAMRKDLHPFWPLLACFLLALGASAFVLAGMTGDGGGNAIAGVASVAYRAGMLALLWWMAAAGFGLAILRFVMPPSLRTITSAAAGVESPAELRTGIDQLALALGLGSALLLVLDGALGTLGLLTAGKGLLSWAVIVAGIGAGVLVVRDAPITLGGRDESADGHKAALVGWLAIGCAVGLLAVAASVAPGWLWSSEFKGFDALSYHLELPKEWLRAGGQVGPVEGNVYSALPSFVEGAFLHLMVLRGQALDGAYACQWWSLFATLATALCVARVAAAAIGAGAAMFAAVVFLATPWTTVIGTLAYNDMYPCMALAAGWLLAGPAPSGERGEGRALDGRIAAGMALLAAAAFGAKPSSVIFTAVPLAVITWWCGGDRGGVRNLRYLPLAIGVVLAALAPWLVRNQLAYGSPTFPFLSGIFGLGPWSAEQMQVFLDAHGAPGGLAAMSTQVWSQWLGYGIGAPPAPTEPWFPLWGVLPAVGLGGVSIALFRMQAKDRGWALPSSVMIVLMLVGWMAATHAKSRFMLPSAVPLALGMAYVATLLGGRVGRTVVTALLAASMALPLFAFMREPVQLRPEGAEEVGAPALFVDRTDIRVGRHLVEILPTLPPAEQQQLLAQADCVYWVNTALPADAKVLAIGYATPFYMLRPITWNTVWDRGVFDRVVNDAPGTPAVWPARLRAEGFTHVLVDPTMLVVWNRSGWLNPALKDPMREGSWLRPFVEACPGRLQTGDGKLLLGLQAEAPASTTVPSDVPSAGIPPAGPSPTPTGG